MRFAIVLVAVALAVGLVACGGGADEPGATSDQAAPAPEPPTAEEQAVLEGAKNVYPSQRVTAAHCTKTGFDSSADIYTCTLVTPDGETDPSEWRLFHDQSGKLLGPAIPADMQ